MGWCSGTEIFDAVIDDIREYIPKKKLTKFAQKLIATLRDMDWDCEGDSKYYDKHRVDWFGGEEDEDE